MHINSFETKSRAETYTGVQLLWNKYWTLFAEKKPKGFGKFFGEPSSKPPPKVENEKPSKSEPPQPSQTAPDTKKKKPGMFDFNMNFGEGGSDGKQSGGKNNSDREKWFTFGMIGSALTIAAISYYNYSYQEISWKDLTG